MIEDLERMHHALGEDLARLRRWRELLISWEGENRDSP